MASKDCLEWLKFSKMDIDVAQQLFSQQQNPRHRPIEIILYHCQQAVIIRYPKHNFTLDSAIAQRGLKSAKRIYNFVCERLGLGYEK